MAAHSEIQKGHEIANEMRRVNKQLKEAQGLAVTYNNRERLFGMPVTNVSYGSLLSRSTSAMPLSCLPTFLTDEFFHCSLQISGAVFNYIHVLFPCRSGVYLHDP